MSLLAPPESVLPGTEPYNSVCTQPLTTGCNCEMVPPRTSIPERPIKLAVKETWQQAATRIKAHSRSLLLNAGELTREIATSIKM